MNTTLDWRTPALTVIDGRRLPIRHVAYLRKVIGGAVDSLITRQRCDPAGRLVQQWDPRLFDSLRNTQVILLSHSSRFTAV